MGANTGEHYSTLKPPRAVALQLIAHGLAVVLERLESADIAVVHDTGDLTCDAAQRAVLEEQTEAVAAELRRLRAEAGRQLTRRLSTPSGDLSRRSFLTWPRSVLSCRSATRFPIS